MPRRVLVIDDRRDALLMSQMLLKRLGYEVDVASNGADGVQLAQAFSPHIVLCDLTMPGMDGFEVARRLRSAPETAQTVIVAVSGHSVDDFSEQAKEAGFDEQVVKPLSIETLTRLLEAAPGR